MYKIAINYYFIHLQKLYLYVIKCTIFIITILLTALINKDNQTEYLTKYLITTKNIQN